MPAPPAPAPPAPAPRRLNSTTPYILGAGACAIVAILGLSQRSAARSERAMGAITTAQRLLLGHAALRSGVGPIVASGSFSMECTDVAAQGWFRTAVMGGSAPPAGRAFVRASRPSGGLAGALGLGGDRPWTLQALRLEVDLAGLEERAAARRAVAERAGYAAPAAAAAAAAAPGSGEAPPPISAVRQALLDMGGQPLEGGLVGLELVRDSQAQQQ
jgi:hypothetical protein